MVVMRRASSGARAGNSFIVLFSLIVFLPVNNIRSSCLLFVFLFLYMGHEQTSSFLIGSIVGGAKATCFLFGKKAERQAESNIKGACKRWNTPQKVSSLAQDQAISHSSTGISHVGGSALRT